MDQSRRTSLPKAETMRLSKHTLAFALALKAHNASLDETIPKIEDAASELRVIWAKLPSIGVVLDT